MAAAIPVARVVVGSFRRDGVEILREVRWTIGKGEHWVVLGPNGSGKTSLLRILAAYEWPSQGEVEVLGEKFGRYDLRELRKRIGLVSSAITPRFPDWDDARSIVLSGLDAAIGRSRKFTAEEESRAVAALETLAAGHIARRPFGALSEGERQRTLIARAFLPAPALLVLDEPCEGLDPLARERLLEDLARFAARPGAPTLVMVTHHLEEIPAFVSHGLLLGLGAVVAMGRVEEVVTDAHLSRAFGAPCQVTREPARRYSLRFRSR
ncbi:MAG TPA: ABC transporter ATP-binding protein [Myxococcales bacterium]|nr:ABC transporter ATP-binding protein [Myxococcales bacterium]